MHDQPSEQMKKWSARERDALYLVADDDTPPVWSLADIGRALDQRDPEAVVGPLIQAGLLHRLSGEFVVATPAAYKLVQIVGFVA